MLQSPFLKIFIRECHISLPWHVTERICFSVGFGSDVLCFCVESLRGQLSGMLAGFVLLHLQAFNERKETARSQRSEPNCFCSRSSLHTGDQRSGDGADSETGKL